MSRDVLATLKDGNARFRAGDVHPTLPCMEPIEELPPHRPLAVIVACSDARVPADRIFDQPAGALFVVRVAGHVLEPAGLASVRFALEHLGARSVVVLGHEGCAAVHAALAEEHPEALSAFVEPIRRRLACVEPAPASEHEAVRRNVRASMREIAAYLEAAGEAIPPDVEISGAYFSLRTSVVEWLE